MARLSMLEFIRGQRRKPAPVIHVPLDGKTVLVVGANTGIGFEACKHFANMNPDRLIMACRSKERGEAAVERLKKETNYTNVELRIVDLSSFASISSFADELEKEDRRLDIVVQNAAFLPVEYRTSPDGWETGIQVNVLANILLSLRLLPQIIKTGVTYGVTPRIVVVGSEVHFWAELDREVIGNSAGILDKLSSRDYCSKRGIMGRRYFDTKLLTVLLVRQLGALLERQNNPVVINTPNPGFCVTEFRREVSGVQAWIAGWMERCLAFTAEEGGRQLVYGALGETDAAVQGQYLSANKIAEPSDFVIGPTGKDVQERLWKESIEIVSKADKKVPDILAEHLKA